jgi:CBS domain containing-hemolysin-like protein
MLGLLGAIPKEGQEVRYQNLAFRAEKVQRRRVVSVLVTTAPKHETDAEQPRPQKTSA